MFKKVKEQRQALLHEIYNATGGSSGNTVMIYELGQKIGLSPERTESVRSYLFDEGYIDMFALGGCTTITSKGIKHIENNGQSQTPMAPNNIVADSVVLVENMTHSQIQQGSHNSTQSYTNQPNDDLAKLLDGLISEISKDTVSHADAKDAAIANAELLKSQANLPENYRNSSAVQKAWSYLKESSKITPVLEFIANHGSKVLPFFGM